MRLPNLRPGTVLSCGHTLRSPGTYPPAPDPANPLVGHGFLLRPVSRRVVCFDCNDAREMSELRDFRTCVVYVSPGERTVTTSTARVVGMITAVSRRDRKAGGTPYVFRYVNITMYQDGSRWKGTGSAARPMVTIHRMG